MDPVDPMDPGDPMDPDDEDEAALPESADEEAAPDSDDAGFEPEGFERWRRDSAVGSIGTGIARGLQNVFAPPPNQPVVVSSVPGDPPDPERLQVILDPDDPSKSVVLLPQSHEPREPQEPQESHEAHDDAGENDPSA